VSTGIVSAAYIAAAVLFILSLGGLSGQESAKRAVWFGIVGMAIAVLVTILGPGVGPVWSPDGTRIAFAGDGLEVMMADGSRKRTVARGTGDVGRLGPLQWRPG
jgi:hypothetical protein